MTRALGILASSPLRSVHAHLSADEIAGMIDGQLAPEHRVAVERHLAVCRECREELTSSAAIVDSVPDPRRRSIPVGIGLAVGVAAAALMLFATMPALRRATPAHEPEVRARPAAAAIQIVSPAEGRAEEASALRFAWHAAGTASTYKLFVTDSAGSLLLEMSTSDTSVGPLAIRGTEAGGRYFWYVDGLRGDGTSVSSPQTSFVVRPR